jgi:hypothetical protein
MKIDVSASPPVPARCSVPPSSREASPDDFDAGAVQVWYGRDETPRKPRVLRAGTLLAELHGCDLRYVRSGSNEVVRRIYMAIRDLNWGTLPVVLERHDVDEGDDSFLVRFEARNTKHEIDFSWTGTIEGTADGVVSYEMDGVSASAFPFAKIGLCIHHPLLETAGRLFRGSAPTTPVGGELPRLIGPQIHLPQEGGTCRCSSLSRVRDRPSHSASLLRAPFEMEDQRNWTRLVQDVLDAGGPWLSPRSLGDRIRQRRRFRSAATGPPRRRAEPVGRVRRDPTASAFRRWASASRPGARGRDRAATRIATIHLRVDLRPGGLDSLARLEEAAAIGCSSKSLIANRDGVQRRGH